MMQKFEINSEQIDKIKKKLKMKKNLEPRIQNFLKLQASPIKDWKIGNFLILKVLQIITLMNQIQKKFHIVLIK